MKSHPRPYEGRILAALLIAALAPQGARAAVSIQEELNRQIERIQSGTDAAPTPKAEPAPAAKAEAAPAPKKAPKAAAKAPAPAPAPTPAAPSEMADLSKRLSAVEKGDGWKWKGDLRFRSEFFSQAQDVLPAGPIADRLRFRLRLRFGAERKFGTEVKGAFRLATGEKLADPTSTNQTFQGLFTEKTIALDRAFLTWTPEFAGGVLSLTGGKMANPLEVSPITWDGDVNPEGAALEFTALPGTRVKACYFFLNENGGLDSLFTPGTDADQYMVDVQVDHKETLGDLEVTALLGYQFVPWVSSFLKTVPLAYQGPKVNSSSPAWYVDKTGMVADPATGLIPDLHVGEVLLGLKHKLGDTKVGWTLHWAHNFNSFGLNGRTGNNENAFFVKGAVGSVKHRGDWAGSLEWGSIEPNAVFSLFSDSDSGSGYNNQVWFKAVGQYGLAEGLTLAAAVYRVERQNYLVLGAPSNSFGDTSRNPALRCQFDLVMDL